MRFALIVLVACSNTPRERAPVATPPPADASIDASIDAPIDATPEPDAPTAQVPLLQCRQVMGPSNRFPKCTEDGKVVELARPIELAILRHGTSSDQGTPVVVDGGTNRGIDKSWRAVVLDAKQRPLPSGAATFVRLDRDTIELLVHMTPDELAARAKAVRFTPP